MRRSDFSYRLPPERIARYPTVQRSASRLLSMDAGGRLTDGVFTDLPGLLRPGDVLVFNDTRVIPARLYGAKDSGGRVEVLVERVLDEQRILAHVRASKAPRAGGRLELEGGRQVTVEGRDGDLFRLRLRGEPGIVPWLEAHGHMPLPPYLGRGDEPEDRERYQTVYAQRPGAVAAPTAGLHFDRPLLQRLAEMGVASAHITLHVGAGTFQPVRAERIEEHRMHSEYLEVSSAACEEISAAWDRGGRVVAVGTTAVRSLETAAASGSLAPYAGETEIFITPGYRFRVVDALITNFHLPESTLLMLVCAFGGYEAVMAAYRHAIDRGYRFYSYGDAMFLERAAQ